MTCDDLRKLLEEMPLEAARPSLADHLGACASCRADIELQEQILRELPAIALNPRARPAVRRRRFAPWLIPAAALMALAFTWFANRPPADLGNRALAHRDAARLYFHQVRHLRGEDPARDARLAAEEWRGSGLEASTDILNRHTGLLSAIDAELVRDCVKVTRSLREGAVTDVVRVAVLRGSSSAAPDHRIATGPAAGQDDVGKFVAARKAYYVGDFERATTLFDIFLRDYPGSAYAADASYWKAQCARSRGDESTLLSAIEGITEEEWVDESLVADVKALMNKPGTRVMRTPDGRIVVMSPIGRLNLSPAVASKVLPGAGTVPKRPE